jgi:hypothetical protein
VATAEFRDDAIDAAAATQPCASTEPAEIAAATAIDAAEARDRLLVSLDYEHLAAAALLSAHPSDRVAAITRALARGRHDPTVVWLAALICNAAVESDACPAQQWESLLLALDDQNSEAWIQAASSRFERGEIRAALDALRRAASSPETRTYWPETVELVERALAAAGGYSFSARAELAFGVAAAHQPDYAAYARVCRAQSADAEWTEACRAYGELAERQGKTELGQAVARGMQIAALEALGDERARDEVAARQRQARETRDRRRAEAFLAGSPRHFTAYLATLRERGETAAFAEADAAAARLAPLQAGSTACRP